MNMNKRIVEELHAAAKAAANSLSEGADYKDNLKETVVQFYRRAPEEVIAAAEEAAMPDASQAPRQFLEWRLALGEASR